MDMFVRHCEGNYRTSNIAYHKARVVLHSTISMQVRKQQQQLKGGVLLS